MANIIDRNLKLYLYDNETNSYWNFLERKTNVKRERIALGIFGFLAIYLIFGWSNDILCNLIGFIYPGYASMLAIDLPTKYSREKWQTYWAIYASFGLFEYFVENLVDSLKIYWLIKCLFLIWLMLSDQAINSFQQFLIQLLIGTKKKIGFTINPPCENIELHIRKYGNRESVIYLRPDSHGFVNTHGLDDGLYDITAYCLLIKPLLSLHSFQISIAKGAVDIEFVDVSATVLHVTFRKNDEQFDGAEITGTFGSYMKAGYPLIGQTDNHGVIQIPLRECPTVYLSALRNGISVNSRGFITVPKPSITPVNIPRQPRYIILDDYPSSFSSCVDPPQENNVRIVVLGNISKTMMEETKMNILKRSYWEIFEKCQKNRWNISLALASSDTSVEWCTASWIQSEQANLVKSWIDRQKYRHTENLYNAMNECMKRHPDVTDVYTMCSLSVHPFYYCDKYGASIEPWGPQCILWNDYREKYPQVKFHFIAFGEDADWKSLEAMSAIGNGIYHQINLK